MFLEKLIKSDSVLCNAPARSKKHCLEILSKLLVQNNPDISHDDIFAKLISRERLGCTGLEQGVALPRCRVQEIKKSIGAIIKLSEPVDFDSQDGQPIDLVFGLLVPEKIEATHHASIELISTLLMDPDLRDKLRAASSSSELFEAMISAEQRRTFKLDLARDI